MDLDEDHLPVYPTPNRIDILCVEADPNLAVTLLILIERKPQLEWEVWPDVCDDDSVLYMEKLISDHHPFDKHIWPGGDTSEHITILPSVVAKPAIRERSLKCKSSSSKARKPRKSSSQTQKPKKSSRKVSSSHKQRRISNYFPPVGSAGNSKDEVLEILSKMSAKLSNLEKQSKKLRLLIKRKKALTTIKRYSFHSLLAQTKKGHKSHT
ncbi:unnamed protein product [Eruca vesicaria subsp. sativa]|uniref:Uncharacterized protein n=1 Tax=Eruca vesicaria subsp. sativa TaxID=29727 RepID=A0ABC8JJD4_ERUVS|nr:unnamed protein product [Eruca vesicaria subsp. sativa]